MSSRESIDHDVEEIEQSVNIGMHSASGSAGNNITMTINRRGSSLFAPASDNIDMDEGGAPGELLVDFPTKDDDMELDYSASTTTNDAWRHSESTTQSMQSMYNSGKQANQYHQEFIPDKKYSGVEEARLQRLKKLENSEDLPGGPNHRPLVGGFAAAAYEAARAHHYSMKKAGGEKFRARDRPPPPI